MELRCRVHSAVQETVTRPATLQDGRTIDAGFGGICVELVEVDGPNAQTIRLIPDDIEAALELFAQDGIVLVTFTPETV